MAEPMYWEATRRADGEEMANDPLVICMGEDIGVAGGTYKATQGLYDKYGPERVMDTPISENGYTGLGIGASFLGVRPIIELMSVNFAWLALERQVMINGIAARISTAESAKYFMSQVGHGTNSRPPSRAISPWTSSASMGWPQTQ